MRRLLFTVTTLALTSILLIACGSDDNSTTTPSRGATTSTHGGTRGILVAARSFEYDPAEIRAKAGENLAIVLTSEDVFHDFVIDELNAYIAADVGNTRVKGLLAEKAGRYTYYCSIPGHREGGMEGTLIVE